MKALSVQWSWEELIRMDGQSRADGAFTLSNVENGRSVWTDERC